MQSLFERRTKERTSQLLEKNYGQKSIPSMYCIPNKYHHPPLTCRCTQANKQIVSVINGCAAALTWNLQIFLGGLQTRMRGQRYSSLDLGEFPVWQLREHIKWRRKNIYFRALSKSPPFPPPFRATWSFFWTSTTTFCACAWQKKVPMMTRVVAQCPLQVNFF